jgi:radical S-adenosyl methionine domain-containing protein 2
MRPETVNLHIWPKCNLTCSYCYATFPGRPRSLSGREWCAVIDALAAAGVKRLTFSGGEPTLHPDLARLLAHARQRALQTSIITNAARLTDEMLARLDLIGITIDSADDQVQARMGRRLPRGRSYREHVERVACRAHAAGVRLKVNTVVTSLNVSEDLGPLIVGLRPVKWKALQFVHVPGENDRAAAALQVKFDEFRRFVERHRCVERAGIWMVAESAATIRTTYVMVDPLGRLFQNGPHGYALSAPLLEVGLAAAMAEVGGYDRAAFEARGGHVDVLRLPLWKGAGQ